MDMTLEEVFLKVTEIAEEDPITFTRYWYWCCVLNIRQFWNWEFIQWFISISSHIFISQQIVFHKHSSQTCLIRGGLQYLTTSLYLTSDLLRGIVRYCSPPLISHIPLNKSDVRYNEIVRYCSPPLISHIPLNKPDVRYNEIVRYCSPIVSDIWLVKRDMTYKRRTTVSHYLIVSDIWLVKRDMTYKRRTLLTSQMSDTMR
jgi:hypothetical protein